MTEFKVGDKVTIWSGHSPMEITTVTRLAGKKMVLANGEEWNSAGSRRWGSANDRWSTAYVAHFKDEHAISLRRRILFSRLNQFPWGKLTLEQLEAVNAALPGVAL